MKLPDEMIQNYIRRRKDELATLAEALQKNDFETFKKLGHQIKGNASSFGFEDLAEIGKRMNQVNEESFSAEGEKLLDDFRSWLDRQA